MPRVAVKSVKRSERFDVVRDGKPSLPLRNLVECLRELCGRSTAFREPAFFWSLDLNKDWLVGIAPFRQPEEVGYPSVVRRQRSLSHQPTKVGIVAAFTTNYSERSWYDRRMTFEKGLDLRLAWRRLAVE